MNKYIKTLLLTPAIVVSLIVGGLIQAASPLEATGKRAVIVAKHKVLVTKNDGLQKGISVVGGIFMLPEVAVRGGISLIGSITGSESIARFGLNGELAKARAILGPYLQGKRNIGSAEEWRSVTKNLYVPGLVNDLCAGLRTPNEAVFVQLEALRRTGVDIFVVTDQETKEGLGEFLTKTRIKRLNNMPAIEIVKPLAGVDYEAKTAVPRDRQFWHPLRDSEELEGIEDVTVISSQEEVLKAAQEAGFKGLLYKNPQQFDQELLKQGLK
jgi:hypothetical protein